MKKILIAISATFLVTSMATAGVPSKPTVSKQSASNDVVQVRLKPGTMRPGGCPPLLPICKGR